MPYVEQTAVPDTVNAEFLNQVLENIRVLAARTASLQGGAVIVGSDEHGLDTLSLTDGAVIVGGPNMVERQEHHFLQGDNFVLRVYRGGVVQDDGTVEVHDRYYPEWHRLEPLISRMQTAAWLSYGYQSGHAWRGKVEGNTLHFHRGAIAHSYTMGPRL